MNSSKFLYILTKTPSGYLISACNFIKTEGEKSYIFQLLKDTHFNSLSNKTDKLEYEIAAISSNLNNDNRKQLILNHYNNQNFSSDITTLMRFNCIDIEKNIINERLIIKNSFEYYSNLNNLQNISIDSFKHDMGLIELSFMVNKYKDKLYISNPTFHLDKLQYDYLINI